MEYKVLQKKFQEKYGNRIVVRTIQNAIHNAFETELVTLRPRSKVPDYVRNGSLESALEAKFRRLKFAIVVEIKDSDEVYPILGQALAEHIQSAKSLFRPNDTIGLGSGRSVFWTVSALKEFEGVDVDPIVLASLTGSMFTKNKTASAGELLDGDTHVTLLLQHFGHDLQIRMIGHSIAEHSETDRDMALRSTWLGDFDSHVPDHVIVGCGVLDFDGHRFNQERAAGRLSVTLQPIAKILEDIMARMENLNKLYPDYKTIIADVCNRFFVVPPPKTLLGDKYVATERNALARQVDKLNKRLITITKHQISKVNNVMLIAGPGKEYALHYLLNLEFKNIDVASSDKDNKKTGQPKRFKIDTLCVDSDTAKKLISIANDIEP